MHPTLSQRFAVLDGLRQRTQQATAEFYQKPGVMPPPLAPLFIVKPRGHNAFEVVNRATGQIVAERFGHNNATGHARELEAQAKANTTGIKQFGRYLSAWAMRISAILLVFAFFGSQQ